MSEGAHCTRRRRAWRTAIGGLREAVRARIIAPLGLTGIVAVVLAATLLAPAAAPPAQDIRFFQIGTGAVGGTSFAVGSLIANVISNPPGSRPCDTGGSCGVPGLVAVAVSTEGSFENVHNGMI